MNEQNSAPSAKLIRHVISKVWNKGQHRVTQVFEYENQDSV